MKITIIGAGAVGIDLCHYILNLGDCRELVLIDLNRERTEAEQLDFGHTSALVYAKNTRIIAGDYPDAAESDIIIITAGAQIKPGQNRLELAAVNAPILTQISKHCHEVAPNAVLIIVTNPCDVLTHFVIKNSPYPSHKVISAGCVVDSARLMKIIADHVQLDPKNIFGFVLGEHGAGSIIPWSILQIAGQPADTFCRLNHYPVIEPEQLLSDVKQAGLNIFNRKLNTNHGIAGSVFRIIRAIAINEYSVLPVGSMVNGQYGIEDVVLNIPFVVNAKGIDRAPLYPFTEEEIAQLRDTARTLRKVIDTVGQQTGLNT